MRVVLLSLILIGVAALAAFYWIRVELPDQHDPWATFALDRPVGWATDRQLRALRGKPEACFEVLEASDLEYERIDDRETGPACGFFDAARLLRSNVSWGGGVTLTCPALVALVHWERHVLQPLAQELFGEALVRVRHYGTYACRNINGRAGGRRSQHATANAIDIAAFVFESGREARVVRDWSGSTEAGAYLERAHGEACKRFRAVLGPDYNTAHSDHFHLDMGTYSICR